MALFRTDFYSIALGMCVPMDVILPDIDDWKKGEPYENIKTLFLLHGMSDDHTAWQRYTSIERYAKDAGIAVVMPEVHLSWYSDMYMGGKFWTYIAEELPETVQEFFPALSGKREDRFAAGLSMGGYGALKLGLRASDKFAKVASLSGGVDALACYRMAGDSRDAFFSAFGPEEYVEDSFNDLFAAARELDAEKRPDVYMWCGTEDFLYDQNLRMRDHLKQLKYNLTYEESPGDHRWKYWDAKIQDVIAWLLDGREDA